MGGKITEIAWEVTAINGTTVYSSYQMKMGCTSTTSLTTWETGLTQVLNPTTVNVAVGTNVHVLDVAYEWDGISNLVIEICHVWSAQYSYTLNCITPWTTTAFNSCYYYYSDGTPACPEPSGITSFNRPVTRFTSCVANPNTNSYTYSWVPSIGLSDTSIKNPVASPFITTTYYVTVIDTLGVCSSTDSIVVTVDSCTSIKEISNSFDINIFPNPSSGIFTITKSNNLNQPIEIKLLNTLGEMIFQQTISKNQNYIDLDISSFSKGIYFLYLSIDNEQVVKKIIKY